MRWSGFSAVLLFAISAPALWAQQQNNPPPLSNQLAAIIKNLASDDFPVRERAQAELAKIPPTQIDVLRETAKMQKDEEVKARLNARVAEIELHALLNPRPLTVNLVDATLADVAAALNKQVGSESVQSSGAQNARFTLKAADLPFWEIVGKIDSEIPMNISSSTSISSNGSTMNTIRLSPLVGDASLRRLGRSESFGTLFAASGNRMTGNWSVRFTIYCDPRLRVAQYSSIMRLDKLIDSEGRNLMPLVISTGNSLATPSRPVGSFSSSATLTAAPGVKGIRELRASIPMSILESERTYIIDLNKPDNAAIDSPRGKITVEKNARGEPVLKIASPSAPGSPSTSVSLGSVLSVRVLDKSGAQFRSISTTASEIALPPLSTAPARGGEGPPVVREAATAEITMTEKVREFILPVELKNFELPQQ